MTPLQKLPKNVGDLGKLIVAKGFKKCPKSKKSPNLVTLVLAHLAERSTPQPQDVSLNLYMSNFIEQLPPDKCTLKTLNNKRGQERMSSTNFRVAMLCWHKNLLLDVQSHLTTFNQSEWFSSAQDNYTTLNFVNYIGSRNCLSFI